MLPYRVGASLIALSLITLVACGGGGSSDAARKKATDKIRSGCCSTR